ncbi:MAG TPA: carboxymuconolactone decarboxylase family protein [Gemmatimonadales bacterium]|nr:carboxymuconolactone decarboxylase family protein [Gemmatimonadales bacterium]
MPKLARPSAPAEAPVVIEPRLTNPAALLPDTWDGIQRLLVAVQKGGVPPNILELTHMRASQINGCSACIDGTIKQARQSGELDDRLLQVAAWRHSSRFTEAERAALELTEEMTRLADRPDPVPDGTWARVAEHFDERALAALMLHVALTNLFNRLNVTRRQGSADW